VTQICDVRFVIYQNRFWPPFPIVPGPVFPCQRKAISDRRGYVISREATSTNENRSVLLSDLSFSFRSLPSPFCEAKHQVTLATNDRSFVGPKDDKKSNAELDRRTTESISHDPHTSYLTATIYASRLSQPFADSCRLIKGNVTILLPFSLSLSLSLFERLAGSNAVSTMSSDHESAEQSAAPTGGLHPRTSTAGSSSTRIVTCGNASEGTTSWHGAEDGASSCTDAA
jgi:hypothetical protein